MIDSGPLTQAMDALGRDTGETIILGQQNGATVQYIHIVPASYPVQLRLKAGLRRPMTCAATGLALLGLKADKEVRAVVRRNNADVAEPRLRVREASFLETIALVRAQGYAETRGNMTPGAAVIAVAITAFGHDMAIGVGGPIERIDASRPSILRLLRQHLGTALRGAKA
jgi:DNA-binding IclR family transcriptional regulator